MEHRGTARTRVVGVRYEDFAPEPGTPVSAGSKPVGTLGSTAQGRGVAMLRLDRVADALASGEPLTAGGVPLRVIKPAWARFAMPDADS
jgi:folate-binding Fe-S cluster repair protein YgfZ